ncbi:MAG: hypothetical protein JO345_38515 [Streptosporangiaceae bacterium]|nr:hypothetical protein [Streptosporangiaceae bacterium]
MNWLLNRNRYQGSSTQTGTPVRSAWTRKPVTGTHAGCWMRSTIVLPGA